MPLGPQGHSLGLLYEVETRLFVNDLELVDPLFGGSIEFGVVPCSPLLIVEFGDNPRVQHHKLHHQIVSNVRLPLVFNVVVLFDVSFEVDMRSHREHPLVLLWILRIVPDVRHSQNSCSLIYPVEELLHVAIVIVIFVREELIREEVQRACKHSSGVSETLDGCH